MMAEVGIPIALTLRYEVNPLLSACSWAGPRCTTTARAHGHPLQAVDGGA
ncbi:hypothetical protein SAFG77S_13476 [Streptomyces afghaniensis]